MMRRPTRAALDALIRDAARALDAVRAVADEADDGVLGGATTEATIAFVRVLALREGASPARALSRLADALVTLADEEGLDDEPRRRRALRAVAERVAAATGRADAR